MLETETNILTTASFLTSPHCDDRPSSTPIDMIVIHNISLPPSEFGGTWIEEFFCGKLDASKHPYFATISHLRVSAHLLIKRNGSLVQFVPFEKRAWHAGQSSFEGRSNCNDFSIGIELEGTDDMPFEAIQYEQLIAIVQLLQKRYPLILRNRIVGHSDIAPGRKTDPGPFFDWSKLLYCE